MVENESAGRGVFRRQGLPNPLLISESILSIRALPSDISDDEVQLLSPELFRTHPASELAFAGEVKCFRRLLLARKNNKVLRKAFLPWSPQLFGRLLDLFVALRYAGKSPARFDEGILVTDQWSRNYFHWVTDGVPKIVLLQQKLPKPEFLIQEMFYSRPFIRESLELLGVNFKILPDNQISTVARLGLVSPLHPTGSPKSAHMTAVREKMVPAARKGITVTSSFDDGPVRIWVSRGRLAKRSLRVEKQLIPTLRELGFEIVEPHTFSLAEQVNLFSRASIVAGVHGAGLTNMIFAQSGCRVLEVRPSGSRNNCYFALADSLGFQYQTVQVKSLRLSRIETLLGGLAPIREALYKMCSS